VGGGEKSKYRSQLPGEIIYHSVNIDPAASPTFLLKPDEPFPLEENTYDACLCLNTLEHIFDARFVLEQIYRALRVDGAVIITVPFIFRIHEHPDDFFRATPSWWRETLRRVGFSQCELQPLVWGRNTTVASIRGSCGLFTRVRFHLAHFADLAYSWVALRSGNGHYSGARGERICATALGYFIIARK
jgi:SAM-dependent methyltransferase